MYIGKRVRSKLELSLIRLWYTLAHQLNFNNQWWYRDFDGHLVNDWAAGPVSENETPDQKKEKINSTWNQANVQLYWTASCYCVLVCSQFFVMYLYNTNLPQIWILTSETSIALQLHIHTPTKTVKPCRSLEMGGMWWWRGGGTATGERRRVKRGDDGWKLHLWNPPRGTHTFNANSSTTGKHWKFENVSVMIRVQLHTHTQHSHFTGNIRKATFMIKELHPEEFHPLITMTPQCIESI